MTALDAINFDLFLQEAGGLDSLEGLEGLEAVTPCGGEFDHSIDYDVDVFESALFDTPPHAPSSSTDASSEDFSTSSGSTQVSPAYGFPSAPLQATPSGKFAPILPRPMAPAGVNKRPTLDGEHSGSESGVEVKRACSAAALAKAAERERQRIRAEKNRQSAANSRLKAKRTMAELTDQVTELRMALADKEAEVMRLAMENQSLKDQVAFFRSVVGEKLHYGGPTDGLGVLPTHRGPSRPQQSSPTLTQGIVCLSVLMAFAVCVAPSSSTGSLTAWLHGVPAMEADGLSGFGAGTTPGARALFSDVKMEPVASAAVTGAAPPVPKLLWSPTAAVTMMLYSVGLHDAAQSVLTLAVGAVVAVASLYLARNSVRAAHSTTHTTLPCVSKAVEGMGELLQQPAQAEAEEPAVSPARDDDAMVLPQ